MWGSKNSIFNNLYIEGSENLKKIDFTTTFLKYIIKKQIYKIL